jgi:3-isopropylmalate/(R)-2-methylmalate dehydratase small subunit
VEKFSTLTAVAAPLVRANVDTDAIIPSREMKAVSKKGLAEGLFAGWRYTQIGGREPNPDFVLNDPKYGGARILLGGENFGCGSSREHAVWALHEYGFRAVIAPSFSPIFYGNCIRNGIVPVRLAADQVVSLAQLVERDPARNRLTVDLLAQEVRSGDGSAYRFEIEPEAQETLLEGLDGIDLTLKQYAAIESFHRRDREERPWIYLEATAKKTA